MFGVSFPLQPAEKGRRESASPVEVLLKLGGIKAEGIAGAASAIEAATYRS